VVALELWLIDQGSESLFITQMETLGYYVAQVIGMNPRLALCIDLCLYIRHGRYSL
jgi:hypothetical protein